MPKPPKFKSHIMSDDLFVRLIQNAYRYGQHHSPEGWFYNSGEEKRKIAQAVRNARTTERRYELENFI